VTAAPLHQDQDHEQLASLATALGSLYVNGLMVDWTAWFAGSTPRRVDLPTYPFQHQRYWSAASTAGNAQGSGSHPLLSGAVELAASGAFVWTGRISALTQPWLADHTVQGVVMVPGTAFVELALQAARDTGCGLVAELNLSSPLVLSEHAEAKIQVWAGAPDESGDRALTVHSQPTDDPHAPWIEHASGRLSAADHVEPFDALPWPPTDAQPLDAVGLYERLAETGFGYGPAFQGLRAAWQRGDELFAEVALPEEVDGTGYGLHPALLDACLHTGALAVRADDGWNGLPFSWTGIALHAREISAVRVRLSPAEDGAVSIALADAGGAPVASIESLIARPAPTGGFQNSAVADAHYRIDWTPVALGEPGPVDLIGAEADSGLISGALVVQTHSDLTSVPADATTVVVQVNSVGPVPASVHAATTAVLALIQEWIASPRADGARLVFATRGAHNGDDPAAAAVWGLVRSAQAEEPGRFALIDLEPAASGVNTAIPAAALTTTEPELLLRADAVLAPRLVRVRQTSATDHTSWGDGTVLITGASGGLAGLVARHLVTEHEVKRLLLVSRRGATAAGTAQLRAELAELGAETDIEACDIADRDAVAGLLARYGSRLTAVVHTAAVLDDGVIGSLTPARLDTVLRPKALGAWHLHELTADLDLSAFVLFSSLAGTAGSAGQGNYAAANAFLDGLARHRRAVGLPGVSLAWGPWADGGRLDEETVQRMIGAGIPPLSPELGLALFDAAVAGEEPVPVLTRLNPAALRARGIVPAVLSSLVATATAPANTTTTTTTRPNASPVGLAQRLGALPRPEAQAELLQLVCAQAAAVLGHAGAAQVEPDRAFKEVGFDSLKALEFRNRLGSLTGLKLPATLVFNHPSPRELVPVLYQALAPQRPSPEASVLSELDRLEGLLSGLDEADEALLGRVAGRLEVIRSRWDARRGSGVGGLHNDAVGTPEDGIDFESASDDEVFDLLDRELGQ
jgi:pimaricinolide synthase PimS1